MEIEEEVSKHHERRSEATFYYSEQSLSCLEKREGGGEYVEDTQYTQRERERERERVKISIKEEKDISSYLHQRSPGRLDRAAAGPFPARRLHL